MKVPRTAPVLKTEDIDSRVSTDPESIELSNEYNRRYLHWDEIQYRECGRYGPLNLWYLMKICRNSTSVHIDFPGMRISYNLPESFHRQLHGIDMSLSTGFLPAAKMDENRKMMYAVSSMMEESIASSQIEGASTTTKVAKNMLRSNRKPKDRSEQMILNNYNAMQFIRSRAESPLSLDLIKELHSIISHDTLEEQQYEGNFRSVDTIAVTDPITEEVFHQPVPSDVIEPMLTALCDFTNSYKTFIHPIVKGIIIHFMMAYIHPFMDGNGRVSRSLFYWFTMKNGYGLMEYLSISKAIKEHRGNYDMAYLLSETDDNDITYFIRYNLEIITKSMEIFSDYLDRKIREQEEALENIRLYGLSTRQEDILAEMIQSGEPFTVYELSSMFNTQAQNIRKDLIVLMDNDLVKICGKDSRKIKYIYSGQR